MLRHREAARREQAQLVEGQQLQEQVDQQLVHASAAEREPAPAGALVLTEANLLRLIQQLASTSPPTTAAPGLLPPPETTPAADASRDATAAVAAVPLLLVPSPF